MYSRLYGNPSFRSQGAAYKNENSITEQICLHYAAVIKIAIGKVATSTFYIIWNAMNAARQRQTGNLVVSALSHSQRYFEHHILA